MTKDWQEPEVGFEFISETAIVTKQYQTEKLLACGLDATILGDFVDASFYIGIGIRAGANSGISAEGNINMVQTLIQHRPIRLGEPLTFRGLIKNITQVPRGISIHTHAWFEDEGGNRVISIPRQSLKPGPSKTGNAGQRPPLVIENPSDLNLLSEHQLTPSQVKAYSEEGNSIHYNMEAANRAGFRAPIIGGGMGVHYLLSSIWQAFNPKAFEMSLYFRRPIFWDDTFAVGVKKKDSDTWPAICLLRQGKVLTEARIDNLEPQ